MLAIQDFMTDAASHRGMSEGGEEFLSLEGGDDAPPEFRFKSRSKKKNGKTPNSSAASNDDTIEAMDMQVLGEYGGTHSVSWPIQDMDCPHCASEAMKALNRLDQVTTSNVSATDGTVTVEIEFEKGYLAEASSVLRSIGNAPDLPHHMIKGVTANQIAARHEIKPRSVANLIRLQPGILDCELDNNNRILIQVVPNPDKDLREAMDYALELIIGKPAKLVETSSKRLTHGQWRMIGSGISFMMLILILVLESMFDNPWLIGTIGTIGVLAGGIRMFRLAWASVQNRQLGFQVLTSLAVIGASYLQAWEEALMVIILVSWTEHMENEALIKAREAMQGGLDRIPRTARRVKKAMSAGFSLVSASSLMAPTAVEKYEPEEIRIDLVHKKDHLEIRSGELIPADGRVVSGTGSIDKSPLTGESVPVDIGVGDEIQAGLTLARGPVVIEVDAVGEETRLAGLIEAVHTFRDKPTRLQGMLENFTAIWVPVVIVGAVIAWAVQPGTDWKLILMLWVVACPCALLLASPVPHAAALSLASKSGTIVRGGDIIESLSKVNLALLDKTGTLTSGKPRIGTVTLARGRRREAAIALAAGLEVSSNHPYAQAIIGLAESESIEPTKVSDISDGEKGVSGKVKGAEVSFVRAQETILDGALLDAYENAKANGHGASLLQKDGKAVALFTFVHDDLREGAEDLVKDLHTSGINVEMLSGDNQDAVTKLAEGIGIPAAAAHGEMTPEGKVNWVTSRSKTHVTMMVGDGFNDAAAMAAADIGVAIGVGESVNLDAADVLIPSDDPRQLANLVDISRRTNSVLMFNIIYSVAVTLVLVYMVLANITDNLAVGVLVHELSVIGVIINGARLSGTGGTIRLMGDIGRSIYDGTVNSFKALLAKS